MRLGRGLRYGLRYKVAFSINSLREVSYLPQYAHGGLDWAKTYNHSFYDPETPL